MFYTKVSFKYHLSIMPFQRKGGDFIGSKALIYHRNIMRFQPKRVCYDANCFTPLLKYSFHKSFGHCSANVCAH